MDREESPLKRKRSKKARKTQTTRLYRKTEREVQTLLSHSSSTVGHQATQDFEERSLQFFHGTGVSISEFGSSDADHYKNEEEEEDLTNEPTPPISLAATFIDIDLSEPPIVSAALYSQKHYHDNSQMYIPSDRLHMPLQLSDCEPQLRPAQIRMLNRYQEEAKTKSGSGKLNPRLIAELTENASAAGRFIIDSTLYRSVCSRQFKTVFLAPASVSQFQGLPNRRCLRLCLKQLRFSAHPQLLEEHRHAHQLEDLYELYSQHVKNQICDKLRQELQLARHVAARLIQANEELSEQSDQLTDHLQRQLRLVQQLRKRYYAESTAQRELLQRLLTQWANLKEVRKQQQFQCTRFQLSLRLVPPANVDASCSAWKQRFQTDLAEVYREHLEVYYSRRRLWDSEKSPPGVKPPRNPQFEEIMGNLKIEYERAFQDPEEPEVHVHQLPVDESLIDLRSSNEQSQKGRNYYLRIYLDSQFVAQTRSYRLETDLHVHMNESIGVLIDRSLPQVLNIWNVCNRQKKKFPTPKSIYILDQHY